MAGSCSSPARRRESAGRRRSRSVRPAARCCSWRGGRTSCAEARGRSSALAESAHVHRVRPGGRGRHRPDGRRGARGATARSTCSSTTRGGSIRRSVERSYDRMHDFRRTMELNYFGPVKLILRLLPGMRERGSGPDRQRVQSRRADEHTAVLGLRGVQVRAGCVLALRRLRGGGRRRALLDRLHAAGAHADDRARPATTRTSRRRRPTRQPT